MSGDGRIDATQVPGPGGSEAEGRLRADRDSLGDLPDGLIDDLLERVEAETVDRTPTWRDRLRELGTPTRVVLALIAAVAISGTFIGVMGTRGDLDASVALWVGGVHLLVLVGALVGIVVALRPVHRAPLGGLAWALTGVLLALPLALSLIPGLFPGNTSQVPGVGHLMCGAGGLVVAVPVAAAVLVFDRSGRPPAWRVLLAGAAAGLAAFGVGHWHCPMVHPVHLLLAHAGLGLIVGLAALGIARGLAALRGQSRA